MILPEGYMPEDKRWYAFYLKSRAEKKVAARLLEAGHENFLPLIKTLKTWSDRKKWVLEPLVKSYIFARIAQNEIYKILMIEGVVKVISFSGIAAPIPDSQIKYLQLIIDSGSDVSVTTDTFFAGETVEVVSGPLKGLTGILTELKGRYKIVMKIDNLECSVQVTINANSIKKV